MAADEQFISFIHNYCDRWCERCEFTSRCRVFATEAEMSEDEKDASNEAFVRNLTNIFADAKRMIAEKAEEFGIEIDPEITEEYLERRERKRHQLESSDLAKLSEKYAFDLRPVLAEKERWLSALTLEDEMLDDVFAVIYWYQFFITAKIQRGLSGILDEDGDVDSDEIRDAQSDANGSIKVALIAVERSILAWTYLMDAKNADVIRPFIKLLEEIKHDTEQKFPNAKDFVRPGFDEIEGVM